jgi:hypothetical protein
MGKDEGEVGPAAALECGPLSVSWLKGSESFLYYYAGSPRRQSRSYVTETYGPVTLE